MTILLRRNFHLVGFDDPELSCPPADTPCGPAHFDILTGFIGHLCEKSEGRNINKGFFVKGADIAGKHPAADHGFRSSAIFSDIPRVWAKSLVLPAGM